MNTNPKQSSSPNAKTAKNKKTWIVIIVIIACVLVAACVGVAVAYNNRQFGNDGNCICDTTSGAAECRNCEPGGLYKPIIYLYPEEKTDISVKLGYPELITSDYPTYNQGWTVTASPNGDLEMDGRAYYALYYESRNKLDFNKNDTGFVVKSDEIANFLEEKLAVLGLNGRESEEFIIYWLPKLQSTDYAYIRFATEPEITENMPLEVIPKPDTTIRVLMLYKNLAQPESVAEQILPKTERTGYTLVEWGGSELK